MSNVAVRLEQDVTFEDVTRSFSSPLFLLKIKRKASEERKLVIIANLCIVLDG